MLFLDILSYSYLYLYRKYSINFSSALYIWLSTCFKVILQSVNGLPLWCLLSLCIMHFRRAKTKSMFVTFCDICKDWLESGSVRLYLFNFALKFHKKFEVFLWYQVTSFQNFPSHVLCLYLSLEFCQIDSIVKFMIFMIRLIPPLGILINFLKFDVFRKLLRFRVLEDELAK